jgi:hypothetical protein
VEETTISLLSPGRPLVKQKGATAINIESALSVFEEEAQSRLTVTVVQIRRRLKVPPSRRKIVFGGDQITAVGIMSPRVTRVRCLFVEFRGGWEIRLEIGKTRKS